MSPLEVGFVVLCLTLIAGFWAASAWLLYDVLRG